MSEFATVQSNFPVQPEYTGMAIAYSNPRLIADQVAPRTMPSMRKEGRYTHYRLEDGYDIPDTRIGRRSRVNMFHASGEGRPYVVRDYGLADAVPDDDVRNAFPGTDPLARATMVLTGAVMRGAREARGRHRLELRHLRRREHGRTGRERAVERRRQQPCGGDRRAAGPPAGPPERPTPGAVTCGHRFASIRRWCSRCAARKGRTAW